MTHPATYDPIAIVGFALRFPGGVDTLEGLWEVLLDGRDLVTRIDPRRWAASPAPDPGLNLAAGVLHDVDGFDVPPFGILPLEAAHLDPHHRLLLELAWEAFEDAAIRPSAWAGSDAAVLVGVPDRGAGGAASRLSRVFDLRGPCMDLQTACTSSLVALHQACEALRTGQAPAALVGGVNLLCDPSPFVDAARASVLSPSGHCRAFAADADGQVPAEGGAVLVLKPLARALRDGDRILGLIRASGINADGARTPGPGIPSAQAQVALMREVLAHSGLQPADVLYVEAHGTGIAGADAIEAGAIGAVYGANRAAALPIGSIKSNLGHLACASGMAGLAKALGVLAHRRVPATLHADVPNAEIDAVGLGLQVTTRDIDLPAATLRVAVNGFGLGGVNAHVLLEAHAGPAHAEAARAQGPAPLVISAADEGALRALAALHADALEHGQDPARLAQAAWERRDWLPERLALPDASASDAVQRLRAFASLGEAHGMLRERRLGTDIPVALMYGGTNGAWPGMARGLRQESALFARALAGVADLVRTHGGPDILAALDGDDTTVFDDAALARPTLFAVQVAAAELLRAQGLHLHDAAGFGTGRIAAAWLVGALTLEQGVRMAVRLAHRRARTHTGGTARMNTLPLPADALRRRLDVRQQDGARLVLDIGPDPVLLRGAVAARESSHGVDRRADGLRRIRDTVLRAALLGAAVDARARFPTPLCGHVELPRYPWRRPAIAPAADDLTPPALPAAAKVAFVLRQAWAARTDVARRRDGEDGAPLRELLPLAYARDALLERGGTDTARIETWRRATPLLRWLLNELRTQDVLRADGAGWALRDDALPPTADIWRAALAASPAAAPELLRLGRVGARLAELADTATPQDTAPPAPPLSHADEPLYASTRTALALALDVLARCWPAGRPMRVLDLGDGDTAVAARLCDAAPGFALNLVLARADDHDVQALRDAHAGDPRVTVATLADGALVPTASTPLPARFDVVILEHVLHRHAQPARALESLLHALCPHALVLLAERHPDHAALFTEGLHPAWWRGDVDGVPRPPLLAPEAWEAMLRHVGWTDCHSLSDPAAGGLAIGGFLTLARPGAGEGSVAEDAYQDDPRPSATAGDDPTGEHPSVCLHVARPGGLPRPHWRACPRRAPGPGEVEVEVHAAGLNVDDAMRAMDTRDRAAPGRASAGPASGGDIAGVVTRCGPGAQRFQPGDTVLGFARAGLASHVVVPQQALRPKPAPWSFAEAATVPTAFFTVWYALSEVARVRPCERILVHGGGGGVDPGESQQAHLPPPTLLATLQIAPLFGADVIVAFDSPSGRDVAHLMGAAHVVDACDPHADDTVLALTDGKGVDVVLSTLARDAAWCGARALRPFGRFIELRKCALQHSPEPAPRALPDTISHIEIDTDALMHLQPAPAARMFDDIMARFAAGDLHPLPHRVLAADGLIAAFRQSRQACRIGDVVLDLDAMPPTVRPTPGDAPPDGDAVPTPELP